MATHRASSPRFRREGKAPPIELTDDDVTILKCVHRNRFVRADDLYRLFPDRSADRLSRRLTLLYRNQFLDRPLAQIDRFRAGGSQALVYGLDTAGARFLKEKFGTPIGSTDWKSRNRTYTRENLDHTLAVSRFMIDLEVACRARQDVSVIPLEDILARSPEETRRSADPSRWAVPIRFNGLNATIHVAPDAIFGLRLTRKDTAPLHSYFFLEIDRGTMTIVPAERVRESDAFVHRATILRKMLTYGESHRQQLPKAHLGIASARVLTLTTSEVRAAAMRVAVYEHVVKPMKLPAGLFLFGVQKEIANPLDADFVDTGGRATRLIPSQPTG